MTLLRTQLGNTLRGHRLSQRRTLRDVSGAAMRPIERTFGQPSPRGFTRSTMTHLRRPT